MPIVAGNRIGPSTVRTNLIDHRIGFLGIAAVVDDDARACGGKRKCSGAADSTRSASYEGNFVSEISHVSQHFFNCDW
jgi:hypothetical protein